MAKKHFVIAGFLMALISFFASRRAPKKSDPDAARKDASEMRMRLQRIRATIRYGKNWKHVPLNVRLQFMKHIRESGLEKDILSLKEGDLCPVMRIEIQGYRCYLPITFVPFCVPPKKGEEKGDK
ncbi:MAG TPA: hypothetical protein VJH69_02100 [Candidatus Paceibacterota bacterium]